MKSKLLVGGEEKTFVLVFDSGDEVLGGLVAFAREQRPATAHVTAIGALQDVTLGYFDWETKKYAKTPLREQVEVLSLIGNLVTNGGEPKVHAHIVVGKRDGSAHGGHLLEAHVRPTLEAIVVEAPRHLQRVHDDRSGLALIKL